MTPEGDRKVLRGHVAFPRHKHQWSGWAYCRCGEAIVQWPTNPELYFHIQRQVEVIK